MAIPSKLKKKFATVSEAQWVPMDAEGTEFLVDRLPNDEFTKRKANLEKPYKKMLQVGGEIPEKRQKEILIECIAHDVLKGWRGPLVEGAEYTPEIGIETLSDPEMRDLLDRVTSSAIDAETFRKSSIETKAKNSKTTSAGK